MKRHPPSDAVPSLRSIRGGRKTWCHWIQAEKEKHNGSNWKILTTQTLILNLLQSRPLEKMMIIYYSPAWGHSATSTAAKILRIAAWTPCQNQDPLQKNHATKLQYPSKTLPWRLINLETFRHRLGVFLSQCSSKLWWKKLWQRLLRQVRMPYNSLFLFVHEVVPLKKQHKGCSINGILGFHRECVSKLWRFGDVSNECLEYSYQMAWLDSDLKHSRHCQDAHVHLQ